MSKIFFVKRDFVNTRLDRWFKKNVSNVPQSLIEKNIRKGNIKVNSKRKKSSYKLAEGDEIKVFNTKFEEGKNKKKN